MSDAETDETPEVDGGGAAFTECITRMVCAYFSNNQVPVDRLTEVITSISAAIVGTAGGAASADDPEPEPQTPAVSIRKSLTDEHLFCLECGKQGRTMRLHIERRHGMTPDQYREKWGLRDDYPMTAPAYARKRSEECKARGFGKKAEPRD